MNRKDLFLKGFRGALRTSFEAIEGIQDSISDVWAKKEKVSSPPPPKPVKNFGSAYLEKAILPPGNAANYYDACTGCGECILACPHQALFPVQTDHKTYAFLDPNANPCHLCSDWPCIKSCSEEALLWENSKMVSFGKAISLFENCINFATSQKTCNTCELACPIPETVTWEATKPKFSSDSCVGCGLCVAQCPSFPKAIRIESLFVASS